MRWGWKRLSQHFYILQSENATVQMFVTWQDNILTSRQPASTPRGSFSQRQKDFKDLLHICEFCS